jgi:hypothetical protein
MEWEVGNGRVTRPGRSPWRATADSSLHGRPTVSSGVRRSRCETPRALPLTWAYFVEADGSCPVLAAMRRAGIGGALPDAMMRLAEVEDVLDQAAYGELIQADDRLRPIALDPHIWELKFMFGARPFRLYFGEPELAPGFLVALHFHPKVTDDPDGGTARQNEEIVVARRRFQDGEVSRWAQLDEL